MKRLNYLIIIACTLFTTAAAAQAKTALQLNDEIASVTDSLYGKGKAWGAAFGAASPNRTYSTLKPIREDMSRFIDRNITAINNTKDVKNSKPLRMAMVDFLGFERNMVKEFQAFEVFGTNTPIETINTAIEHLKTVAAQEDGHLKAVVTAQEAYATENGFKIAPPAAGSE